MAEIFVGNFLFSFLGFFEGVEPTSANVSKILLLPED